MGLFDKAKEAYKHSQEKRADQLAMLPLVEYMGGYEDKKKATGNLFFYGQRVEFKVALSAKSSFTILNTDITDIAVEGKDEVSRRVTVTRLLAVGIFAFALKKKGEDKEGFVTIVLSNGQEVIFHIKNKSPMEVRARLSKAIAQVRQVAKT